MSVLLALAKAGQLVKLAKRDSWLQRRSLLLIKDIGKKVTTSIEWQTRHRYQGKLYVAQYVHHQSTPLSEIETPVCQATLKSSQSSAISSDCE